jgi:hypothetical protein
LEPQNGGSKVLVVLHDARVLRFSVDPTSAQTPNPELEACRSTGLWRFGAAIRDQGTFSFDVDGMTVAKANTKVEDTPIKTIVIGDAYLEKGKHDTRRTFLCLIARRQSTFDVLY